MTDRAAPRHTRVIERALPGVRVMRKYRRDWLAKDLVAGLGVCVLSIPMSLACAEIIGVEPQQGLFAAVVGLVVFSLLTRSRLVVVGPETAAAILVASAIAPLGHGDAGRVAALVGLVAAMSGALMLLMAAARLGAAAALLSRPVVLGFMNGVAIVGIASQLGSLLGIELRRQEPIEAVAELLRRAGELDGVRVAVGVGLVAAMFGIRKLMPRAPAPMIVFAAGTAASALFNLEAHGFAVVGDVPRALPQFALPHATLRDVAALVPGAVGLALLTFPQVIILGRAFNGRRTSDDDANRELLAAGAANVMSGLFRGFALAATSTRTSIAYAVGGRSQVASLFAAAFLVAFLLFLTPVIAKAPVITLAALIVYAGMSLVDVESMRSLWRVSWRSSLIGLFTTAGVVIVGVVPGILVGVLLSLAKVIHKLSRPPGAVLRVVPERRGLHDVPAPDGGEVIPGLLAYRLYAPLIFSNASWFVERIDDLVTRTRPPVREVLLDAQAVSDLDVTAAAELVWLIEDLRARGITFSIANANRPLRDKLRLYQVERALGEDHVYRSVQDAMDAFLAGEAEGRGASGDARGSVTRREA